MNVNTAIQSMLPSNNPIAGGYIRTTGPTTYEYITKEQLASHLQPLLGSLTPTCKQNCTTTYETVPNPCGCGTIQKPVTTCTECGCLPEAPVYIPGTPTVFCDYRERIDVTFPAQTLLITVVNVDGTNATPSLAITSIAGIEDYFRTILGTSATVAYVAGYIEITTDKVLTNFEYSVNGVPNVALFNQTNCRTVDVGAYNRYVFEQTPDNVGQWVLLPQESVVDASEVTYAGTLGSTNVQDALNELNALVSAAEKYIVSMVASVTPGTYTATMNDGSTFSIDLSSLLDNTDTQTLAIVAPTSISISGGNTIDLSVLVANATNVVTADSLSIDFSGNGTALTPLTAVIIPGAIRSLADVEVQDIFGVTQYYAFSTNV